MGADESLQESNTSLQKQNWRSVLYGGTEVGESVMRQLSRTRDGWRSTGVSSTSRTQARSVVNRQSVKVSASIIDSIISPPKSKIRTVVML